MKTLKRMLAATTALAAMALAAPALSQPTLDQEIAVFAAPPPAPRPITLHAGELIDGRGKVMRDVTITVLGSKITAVTPGKPAQPTYDFARLTLLPGMIDTHVHITAHFNDLGKPSDSGKPSEMGKAAPGAETPEQAALKWAENVNVTLMGGFTTIQSVGSDDDYALRDAIARGRMPGPRLLTSGQPITDPSWTPEQIRAFVDKKKADGSDLIKIFASKSSREGGAPTLTQEQVTAACSEARKVGLRTWVHAHAAAAVRMAIVGGCFTVTHARFATQAELDLAAQHGTYIEPSWGVVQQNYIAHQANYEGTGNYTKDAFRVMREYQPSTPAVWHMMLKTKGLKLLSGGDTNAGAEGHNAEETIWRVQHGQAPMEALVVLTSGNAKGLNLGETIGALAPGYEADIVGVVGDPLKDITSLRNVRFVMKGGVVYKNVAR